MSDHIQRRFALPLPGTTLADKYRIESQIGEGGMGVVLRATHLDLEQPVAIKMLRPEYATREELVSRFLFEARAAARLRNEHVVRVLDVVRNESWPPYIVLEYLEGYDLGAYLLEYRSIPIMLAVDAVLQACEALAEAHAIGLVHRDLKPENLFVTTSPAGAWSIKVLDFGVSKDLRPSASPRVALTNPSSAVGSPHYMAPEQMLVKDDLDARADIWSLGAILYELVTGHAPFEGETLAGVCAKVLEGEAPLLRQRCPDAPAELENIIVRCLTRDRDARFADVASLAEALAPFAGPAGAPRAARVSLVGADAAARASRITTPVRCTLDAIAPITLQPIARSIAPEPAASKSKLSSWIGLRGSRRVWLTAAASVLCGVAITVALVGRASARAPQYVSPASQAPLAAPAWERASSVVQVDATTAPQPTVPVELLPAEKRAPAVAERRKPRKSRPVDTGSDERPDAREARSTDALDPIGFGRE